MTAEWDAYRRGIAREWLKDVRRDAASLPGLRSAVADEDAAWDMLGCVRYDRIGGPSPSGEGDDSMVAHIARLHASMTFDRKEAEKKCRERNKTGCSCFVLQVSIPKDEMARALEESE